MRGSAFIHVWVSFAPCAWHVREGGATHERGAPGLSLGEAAREDGKVYRQDGRAGAQHHHGPVRVQERCRPPPSVSPYASQGAESSSHTDTYTHTQRQARTHTHAGRHSAIRLRASERETSRARSSAVGAWPPRVLLWSRALGTAAHAPSVMAPCLHARGVHVRPRSPCQRTAERPQNHVEERHPRRRNHGREHGPAEHGQIGQCR
jgi:hypothetical protein